jgi:SAM-dependent methyltransferase
MPTLPQDPAPAEAPQPHQARQIAESFGVDAARYDRTRPRYPAALVDKIVAASPGLDVLDVGAGTGISSRQFQAAGCTVLGVEPDARMAGFARRAGVEVEVATFEAWDPAGRGYDTVVSGTAWHWVDPVAGAVKAGHVLRPDGQLAVFWNVFQPPASLAAEFAAIARRVLPDSPVQPDGRSALEIYQVMLDKAAGGMRQAGAFSEPEQWRYDWARGYTKDEWLDMLPTQGLYTRLPPGQLASLLAETGDAIDAFGGRFTVEFATVAVTAVRVR